MDEKDYFILKYVYEENNLGRAAKKLFLTPPALTYRMQQLEKQFGVPILRKNGKQIYFTPEGKYLVKYAMKKITELQHLRDHLLDINATLRIGASTIYARYRLPEVLNHFLDMYPQVKINLNAGFSKEIFNLLMTEEIHLGITRGNFNWPGFKLLIDTENICIISKDKIKLEDLPKTPRIHYKLPSNFNRRIEAWWLENFDEPPLIHTEIDDYDTIKALTKIGYGYAIIPSIFLNEQDNLYQQNLIHKDGSPLTINTWLLCSNESKNLVIVKRLIDYFNSTPSLIRKSIDDKQHNDFQ